MREERFGSPSFLRPLTLTMIFVLRAVNAPPITAAGNNAATPWENGRQFAYGLTEQCAGIEVFQGSKVLCVLF